VGTTNQADTAWFPVERDPNITADGRVSSGASLTYGVESTLSDVFITGFDEEDDADVNVEASGQTATWYAVGLGPIVALRFAITSFVSGTLTAHIVCPRKH
jgi:hypothetical protein